MTNICRKSRKVRKYRKGRKSRKVRKSRKSRKGRKVRQIRRRYHYKRRKINKTQKKTRRKRLTKHKKTRRKRYLGKRGGNGFVSVADCIDRKLLASGPRHVTTETRSVAQCTCCKDKCSHDFKIEKKPHYTTPPIWRDAAEACLNSCNDNTYCKIKSPILLPKWTTGSGVVVGATQRKQHHKKVAIIGSGPVGLLIAYNLITKPEFFNPTPEKTKYYNI